MDDRSLFMESCARETEALTKRIERNMDFSLDLLSGESPEFYHCLMEYEAGHYTLEDGSQDAVLLSIRNQVIEKQKFPSDKQMEFFRKRCGDYCAQAVTGEDLISPEAQREKNGIRAKELFALIEDHEEYLKTKDFTMLESFRDYYNRKGFLSSKQVHVLTNMYNNVKE